MKPFILLAVDLLAMAVLALGCTSIKPDEKMLSTAGFKVIPATTPEQLAHLQTLPKHRLTMVVRGGKTFFAYPDTKRKALYLGAQPQYDEYQSIRRQSQLAADQAQTANAEASWAPWGPWGNLDFVDPTPAFRRFAR
jgi:hypothetical protein